MNLVTFFFFIKRLQHASKVWGSRFGIQGSEF